MNDWEKDELIALRILVKSQGKHIEELEAKLTEANEHITCLTSQLNPVLCYGLKTDVNGNLFEGSRGLLAWADDIKEIEQICDCGEKLQFILDI